MARGKGNGPGRPREFARVRWIKFTDEQDASMERLARIEGIPISAVARRLVQAGMDSIDAKEER